VVARLGGAPLRGMLSGIQKWTVVEGGYEVSELRIKLACWNVERRIEEMKNDLHADGFCTKAFFATEAVFLGVVLSYNLLPLYQAAVTPQSGYRKPSTMRVAVFVGGAILGRKGREVALRFSEGWGGLKKHMPLIEGALKRGNPIAPLLTRPPTAERKWSGLDCGGCAI
jgi:hypothetical protein